MSGIKELVKFCADEMCLEFSWNVNVLQNPNKVDELTEYFKNILERN